MNVKKIIQPVIRSLRDLYEGYQLTKKTVERLVDDETECLRTQSLGVSAPESVYPRGGKRAAGASTLSILLLGRRLGYSGSKTKIHIVRELGYSDGVFLCGAQKAPKEPLFIHHIAEEGLDLCKSCINLAKKGIH